jgi:hypothetical protein
MRRYRGLGGFPMSDAAVPDKFWPLVRWLVNALAWMLPLVAIEQAAEGHDDRAIFLGAAALIDIAIASKWERRRHMAFLLIGVGAIILAGGIYFLASKGASDKPVREVATLGVSSPAPESQNQTALVERSSLRLLMRPRQDPQEISKENIWRWFVFKALGLSAEGKEISIGTFIFLSFDRPTNTNYRRVFSPSEPNLRFDVLDISARSMVIFVGNVDVTGQTVEIHVSANPL